MQFGVMLIFVLAMVLAGCSKKGDSAPPPVVADYRDALLRMRSAVTEYHAQAKKDPMGEIAMMATMSQGLADDTQDLEVKHDRAVAAIQGDRKERQNFRRLEAAYALYKTASAGWVEIGELEQAMRNHLRSSHDIDISQEAREQDIKATYGDDVLDSAQKFVDVETGAAHRSWKECHKASDELDTLTLDEW